VEVIIILTKLKKTCETKIRDKRVELKEKLVKLVLEKTCETCVRKKLVKLVLKKM